MTNKRTTAMDGYQPRGYQPSSAPAPKPVSNPEGIQGGYQAPTGGKPAAPTTGSGVKK